MLSRITSGITMRTIDSPGLRSSRILFATGLGAVCFIFCQPKHCQADFVLSAKNVTVSDGFESFRGDGFSSSPTATQLDTNTYAVFGLSGGDVDFGGTNTSGAFARGAASGAVSVGGIYGFDVSGGGGDDFGIGVQQTDDDATPGSLKIRVANQTGSALSRLRFEADTYFFNDTDGSIIWSLAVSQDDVDYITVGATSSDLLAEGAPVWGLDPIDLVGMLPFSVDDGDQFFLRITGDDLVVAGERDQFALGRLALTAVPEPSTGAVLLLMLAGLAARRRRIG